MAEQKDMAPISGEPVDTDGIYQNEWGREEWFNRGEIFPADPQMGTTEWKLVSLASDTHEEGKPDPRYREERNVTDGKKQRLHHVRQDR